MAGCLHVVSTPIGNLEDITLRALRVLREVGLIAAEDTRRTARLLQHYSICTRTTSLHEHNERQRIPSLVDRLRTGARIALVSDAGTPGISDPGCRLVAAALETGIRVEAVPGPSAVIAALAVSGFRGEPFLFMGFPPVRSKDRKSWMEAVGRSPDTVVFFEAPHRLRRTLKELTSYSVERPIALARELTKLHEELVNGPIKSVLETLREPRGEFVVVCAPTCSSALDQATPPRDDVLLEVFGQITKERGLGRRTAIRELADQFGIKVRDVYQAIERAKRPIS